MGKSHGLRSRTRYAFARDFKKHGAPGLATYLETYRVGDIVDIKVNGSVQKGMPFKFYHGRTGIVYNVTKSAVGVIIQKVVGNRYIEKKLNVKVEHLKHSKSRTSFVARAKENSAKAAEAKKSGVNVELKRQPAAPRGAEVVAGGYTTLAPSAYETYI